MAQKIKTSQMDPVTRQSGFGYITNSTSNSKISTTVTFPVAMAAVPKIVLIGMTNYKNLGTPPTSMADMNGTYGGAYSLTGIPYNLSTTGFSLDILSGSSMGASYVGFTWIAEV